MRSGPHLGLRSSIFQGRRMSIPVKWMAEADASKVAFAALDSPKGPFRGVHAAFLAFARRGMAMLAS
ncbi:hypothetical protein GCM10009754_22140 [Amycolatopsis minnesotensis]|uniref:Uncharacterized protein n=1 Tax=Amycolatopsis minnesotensis TaxID=337894 RepID=A0ABP5BUA8_9PSEU